MNLRLGVVVSAIALLLAADACHHAALPPPVTPAPKPPTFTASRIRAFSDSLAVTAIADSPTALFAGTARGLIRWEGGRYTLLTAKDGLPADRVAAIAVDPQGGILLATARGLSRGLKNVWTNWPAAPVGNFLTGLASDGRTTWAGGPEGLGRLRSGRWEHYFSDSAVTALAAGYGNTVWIGTSGSGVLRILRGGEKIEHYGPSQGCEVDVVRGMVAVDKTVIVIGEGPSGPRAAYYDGERFYSYELTSPTVLEWAARAGARTLVGAGAHLYTLAVAPPESRSADAEPPANDCPVQLRPLRSYVVAPRVIALKPDLSSTALDDPPNAPKPPKAITPPPMPRGAKVVAVIPPAPQGPPLVAEDSPVHLPDGVIAVGGSERGLLVGTRFVGALRIENDVPRQFRINDLAAGAVRLTVACIPGNAADDCYLATGGTRAFRFDGQSFEIAQVDPEPGSHVLAVLHDPHGDVLAIHRGAGDQKLRISRVADGRWTPIGIQSVAVPNGPPELNFAEFAPNGHLWVGLRYVDKDGDPRDFGADEIALDSGKVIVHKELPTDMVALYWKAPNEAWFATRSGAARLLDGKLRVFTENDGLESELTRDIGPAPAGAMAGQIFVATKRGTGRYDGTRWTFPRLGAFYPPATALDHDAHGNVFIGTNKGLYCVGECPSDVIDQSRGLNDDQVDDLAVDGRNRVWVLTQKGINIVEP
jgi:hypothetical protein